MHRTIRFAFVVCAGSALAGCSYAADALWPSLNGADPAGKTQQQSAAAPMASQGPSASSPFNSSRGAKATRRPLVVIRFDRRNVPYEQALYSAVSRALDRRPSATFDLVAVAPSRGAAAQVAIASNLSKRNAETVLRSLSDMGLPLQRVRLSAMTSDGVTNNEVHIYVR